jgi:uncharacterized protein YndB with AHSA1/START domain
MSRTMDRSDDYGFEVRIEAAAAAIYEALATPAGISRWWTTRVEGGAEEGETMRLFWSDENWTELRVERLRRPSEVELSCTAADNSSFADPEDWVGTRLRFRLTEVDDGTELAFTHEGLRALDCFEICERGWGHHLGSSLKQLVEEGKGLPKGS